MNDFFDPPPEVHNVVLLEVDAIRRAEQLIVGCQECSEDAEIPFDNILDRVTGCDPSITDYVMEKPAKCPRCFLDIREKTLIEPDWER
jgi:hypothetical protein